MKKSISSNFSDDRIHIDIGAKGWKL